MYENECWTPENNEEEDRCFRITVLGVVYQDYCGLQDPQPPVSISPQVFLIVAQTGCSYLFLVMGARDIPFI